MLIAFHLSSPKQQYITFSLSIFPISNLNQSLNLKKYLIIIFFPFLFRFNSLLLLYEQKKACLLITNYTITFGV